MSDQSAAKPAAKPEGNTEATLVARIENLKAEAAGLEKEIRILEGRIKNRAQVDTKALQTQNEKVKARLGQIQGALYAYLMDELKARKPEELEAQVESLKKAALRYFKDAQINLELWKNIES